MPTSGGEAIAEVFGTEDWERLMETFLSSQDIMDKSRETYRWGLRRFFKWCRKTGRDFRAMTPVDIVAFKNSLSKERLTAMTIAAYMTAVRRFYGWTEMTLIYPNIARSVRPPRNRKGFKKTALDPVEATELLEYMKGRSLRDYAIVNLILRTGLRTIEVTRADVGDITRKRGKRVMKVWGKGADEKDAFVIIGDPVWEPIKRYLDGRADCGKDKPLFVTEGKGHRGERMSPRSVQRLCKEALRAVGLEGHEYSAHSLRHTTAVTIIRQGGDLNDVQRVLRHASQVTSQVYTASIEQEVRLDSNPEALLDDAF
jgi:integrase/recombinase XerC/integrase/recombinase XerD